MHAAYDAVKDILLRMRAFTSIGEHMNITSETEYSATIHTK